MSRSLEILLGRIFVIVVLGIIGLPMALADEWYRVESNDGRASVLFPDRAEEIQELVDKTPGGNVVTQVAEYQGDGILMSISETKLPPLAATFAGPKIIFKNSKGSVLKSALGREISSKRIEVAGADAAMMLRYESVDFDDEDHPGYTGLAVFVIVDKKYVYVVNSMISKKTPDNQAMQDKLLDSIQIHE